MKKVYIIILFSLIVQIHLSAQWERINNGWYGISYSNAENNNSIYSCFSSLWKSKDDGVTYKELEHSYITRINIVNNIFFTLKSNNVSVSFDSGSTWKDAAYDYLYFEYCVNSSNNILSIVERNGLKLILSKDYGKSWIDVSKNINLKDSVELNHKIYSINNDFYYYDTSNNILYYSTDDCKTWKVISYPEVGLTAKIDDGKIFLLGDKKLYYSIDNGVGWIKRAIPETPKWFVSKSNIFIIGNSEGRLLKSIDFGINWELLPFNKDVLWPDNNNRQIFISSKGHFFANGFSGFYYSHDGGYTWGKSTLLDYGTKGSGPGALDAVGNKLFSTINGIIVTSENNGLSWSANRNTEGYSTMSYNKDTILAYYYTYKMNYSTDNGDTWKFIPYNIADTLFSTTFHKGYIYYSSFNNGMHRSKDEGKTWEKLNDLIFYKFKSNQKIMLGLNYPDNRPYISNDDGKTWKLITFNNPMFRFFTNIFLFDDLLVIMTEESIFISKDNGASWKSIINNLEPLQLVYITDNISYINNRLVIAGSGCPVYISDELLSTWYPIGENLLFNSGYGIVNIGDTLFLTNPGGLYKRSLSEILIKVANNEIDINGKSIDIIPNPANEKIQIINLPINLPIKIDIMNTLGYIFESKSCYTTDSTLDLEISNFASGLYFVRFSYNNQLITTKKLIVLN